MKLSKFWVLLLGLLTIFLLFFFWTKRQKPSPSQSLPNKVFINHSFFIPALMEIKVGESVTWENEEEISHQVGSRPKGEDFKSNILKKGDQYSFVFNEVGEYDYTCLLNPQMGGKIIVKP